MTKPARCSWVDRTDSLMIAYHDEEWGRPLHDERALFEFLILEGAQAGLSWRTILHKREAYRDAFAAFDPDRVARFDARHIAKLLANPAIVRNRLKIESAVSNAQAWLELRGEPGGPDAYLWSFVGASPRPARRRTPADVPARSPESDAMSKALKARGFRFVGTTIAYAFMQATGMVNDHLVSCPQWKEAQGATRSG